jgi:acetylcholinesterase
LDATKEGPICPQPTNNLENVSEDCLILNIYTPELPQNGTLKPVIVYIHGDNTIKII